MFKTRCFQKYSTFIWKTFSNHFTGDFRFSLLGETSMQIGLETKYNDDEWWILTFNCIFQWIEFEQWWIIISIFIIFFSVIFTFTYALHFCCGHCKKSTKKEQTTDKRFDLCRRRLLNFFIAVVLLVNMYVINRRIFSIFC